MDKHIEVASFNNSLENTQQKLSNKSYSYWHIIYIKVKLLDVQSFIQNS